MEQVRQILNSLTFSNVGYLNNLISSLLIIFVLWITRFFILKIIYHQTENASTRYSWRKSTLYFAVFLAIILVGRSWLNGLEPILTFLGIIAVGLTISMKEILLNIAGMIVIMWRNVFVIGDRIEIADRKGDVVGISVFYFTLMEIENWVEAEQSTGRIIKMPNALVLTQPITNYTKSFPYIWDEISIGITFESNWQKAREIMKKIAKQKTVDYTQNAQEYVRKSNDELIRFHFLTPKVYIKPVMSSPAGIFLTLRYLCEPKKRRDMEDALWEEILNRFEETPDITIAHG